jgi:hypothetical protein
MFVPNLVFSVIKLHFLSGGLSSFAGPKSTYCHESQRFRVYRNKYRHFVPSSIHSSFSYYNFSVGCVWQSFGSRDITTDD